MFRSMEYYAGGMPPDPAPSARRNRSRRLLLDAVHAHGAATRADLARSTGLSRSAVAQGVQALVDDGLIAETYPDAPTRTGARGRPSALLVPAAPSGWVVGIDFGHAHVAAALAGTDGTVRTLRRGALDVDGRSIDALDLAARLVAECLDEAGVDAGQVLGAGAGIPGPIDVASRLVRSPTILSTWVDLDPVAELSRRLGLPVRVGNDADLGAQGELRFGAARGARDFLYVKASHGIGAGLVLNGATYRGSVGIAGEIGHTQLAEGGAWCRCGNRGCLETVVSITEVRRQLEQVRPGELGDDAAAWPDGLLDDPVAERIVVTAGRTIGRVLADLCNCLNPGLIVIGGELGAAGAPLVDGVRESIDRRAQPATAGAVQVRAGALGPRAELMGAVAVAIEATLS